MNTQLLCTFSTIDTLETTLQEITRTYDIIFDKIFVLKNCDKETELFCTYNINVGNSSNFTIPKTISMHRKKNTNSLYTINALNELIKAENDGILDTTFVIDWRKYRNSIIITDNEGAKIIHTRIHKIEQI